MQISVTDILAQVCECEFAYKVIIISAQCVFDHAYLLSRVLLQGNEQK